MKIQKIVFLFFMLFVISYNPDMLCASEDSLEEGIRQYRAENYEEALDALLKARKVHPESSVAAFYTGMTYKQLKDYRLAEKNLREAIQLTPPVKDAYLELADVLYTLGQFNEAEGWALKAEQEGVKPANASFLKGLILMKRGRTNEAIESFRKAEELDSSLAQSATLQIALAQVEKQEYDEAQQSLRTIEKIDPTSEYSAFAREYDKSLTRTLETYRPWHLNVGVAYQYDDNVVLKPIADIPGVDITGEKDSSILATLGVLYSPRLKAPFFLNCEYDLYTDTYFHTNSHNLFVQTLSVNPGVNFTRGFVSLPLSYSYILVHERGYMGVFDVKPAVQIALHPSHILRFSAGYEKRELFEAAIDRDEDRDGNVFSASAGYIHPFAKGRGVFSLIYEYTDDNTDGRNWDNRGNRFSLGLLLPSIIKKTNLILSGDAFLQRYKNTHTVFDKKRRDNTFTASATLERQILRGLYLSLQYSYVRADSNIAVYDYDRNIYTAGFEYRF